MILEDMPVPLTQRQILDHWPDDFKKPDKTTIARLLQRSVTQGLLSRTGTGFRNDAYCYELEDKRRLSQATREQYR